MKNLKYLIFILFALTIFTLTACKSDDETTILRAERFEIVETFITTEILSTFAEALTRAELETTLQDESSFTLFAPTNASFRLLLDSNAHHNSLSDMYNVITANVIKFQVLPGNVNVTDLADSYVTSVALGPNEEQVALQVGVRIGAKSNGSVTLSLTDMETTNKAMHTTEQVMLLPSVVDLALQNPVFSTKLTASSRSDSTKVQVSIFSTAGPFTIFASTYVSLQPPFDLNSDWNSSDEAPLVFLQTVLNNHVLSGANLPSKELTDNQEVITLDDTSKVDLCSIAKLGTISNQSANSIPTDA